MWKKSSRHRLRRRHMTVGLTSYENFSRTQQREIVTCLEEKIESRSFSGIVGLFFLHLPNHRLHYQIYHRICRLLSPSCCLFFIQEMWLRAAYLMRAISKRCMRLCPIHLRHPFTSRLSSMPRVQTLYFSVQCQNPRFSLFFFSFLVCLQPLYNYRFRLVHPTIDWIRSSNIVHFYSNYFIILTFGHISKRSKSL